MPGLAGIRRLLGLSVFVFLLVPGVASAQSAFSGIVRDTSGAVLPGVTVEASSPVLIEKTRAAVTDGEGRYTITDLRPGTYVVVFTLTGFNTFRRDGLELPANFNMQINADLRVGSLEESITVTGDAPIVDVQSTQRTQVLNRDLLDALPSARNYSGLAALMPGVRMSNTDVGGNQQMEQIYMTVHGSRQTDTTVQVDGLQLNSLMNDGQVQAYFSDAANAEVTYQTSGIGADVSGGGVRINMIPKEGGNRVSGSAFAGGTNGKWQSNNVSEELKAAGLAVGEKVDHISDYNFAIGGPIRQDRLWYFTTFRRIATNELVANNFYRSGEQGMEDQWIYNMLLRLTWQMTPKNKITAYYDRYPKFKGHEMGALTDPDTAAGRRDWLHAIYYTGSVKYTSTVTSRLLLEAGYSTNMEYLWIGYQPGIQKDRGSQDWFSQIGKNEVIAPGVAINPGWGTQYANWNGRTTPATAIDPKKYVASASMSYVTGSHNVKGGFQWGFGSYVLEYDINGDLTQRYNNGVPYEVLIWSTPVRSEEFLNGDMGFFIQDQWTIDRLTVNAGLRAERFRAQISDQDIAAGRFVPARHQDKVECMPCWLDWAPRFGVSYDLFGNARTALKGTINRYMAGQTLSYAQRYNPLRLQFETRSWNDANRDDVAQETEIGPTNNLSFGLPVFARRPGPDGLDREYDIETSLGIQHELFRGLSVSGSWFRRARHNELRTDNLRVGLGDYAPVQLLSPLDGEVFTVYNLDPSKRAQLDQIDVNSTDSSLRSRLYNGYEVGLSGRLHGAQFFGGWTFDQLVDVQCDSVDNPNMYIGGTAYLDWCDQKALDIPFRHEFKLSGSYTLPLDIQVNAAFQSYAGPSRGTFWAISSTTTYGAATGFNASNCVAPCVLGARVIPNLLTAPGAAASMTLALQAPGTDYYGRMNQLDLGFRKLFRFGRYQYSAQADIFNFTNNDYVKTETRTYGAALGRPTSNLQPRTLRLAVQMRF
jgi:Carboxypeptidase regulatory-like domain/TonB-dependent Receptor Plug Domain